MAYPKTTDSQKETFIVSVFNKLESIGAMDKCSHLQEVEGLDKKYLAAQRYDREMRKGEQTQLSSKPTQTDLDIVTASTEDVDVELTTMEAQKLQEKLQNHVPRSPSKRKEQATTKQLKKERKKELLEKHYELLDWIQCVDDGIVKDNANEARRMVNVLNDYADKLDKLIREKYRNRAVNLLRQYREITASMQNEEIAEIEREVEALAPQYAR